MWDWGKERGGSLAVAKQGRSHAPLWAGTEYLMLSLTLTVTVTVPLTLTLTLTSGSHFDQFF